MPRLAEQLNLADCNQVDLGRRRVLVDRAEEEQKEHGQQDREDERGAISDKAQEHRAGQAGETGHARYSRPVRLRKTSSRVAPWTRSPASASALASPASA